jgi:hypothetical protein
VAKIRKTIKQSLLWHCTIRAMVLPENDLGSVKAKVDAGEIKLTAWNAVKAMPKAMRVATFIILWALGMKLEGLDRFSITKYQSYWKEKERAAYRAQKEFRELWPEFETPHEIAVQLLKQLDAKKASKEDIGSLPMTLMVEA